MKFAKKITIFVFILIFCFATYGQRITVNSEKATVYGKVKEVTGLFVGSVEVTIESPSGEKMKVLTDKKGAYQVTLSSGEYQMKVIAKDFYPYNRASIKVLPNDNIEINITLVFDGLTEFNKLDLSEKKEKPLCTYLSDELKEDILQLSITKKAYLYSSGKASYGDKIKYVGIGIAYGACSDIISDYANGKIRKDKYLQVLFTLDKFTISADEVIYELCTSTILFKGNVTLEDGKSQKKYNEFKINLKLGEF
jgi:hypothetical protein